MKFPWSPIKRVRSRWPPVEMPEDPPVAVLLPQPLRSAVVRLRDEGQQVAAVRLVREQTGLGMWPALKAVRVAEHDLPDAG